MKLAVIRHAIAEDPDAFAQTGQEDGLRPLTQQGRKKMRRAAAGLKTIMPTLDVIGSSPLVRAVETAEIVAQCYGGLRVVQEPALAPGGAAEECLAWLQQHKGTDTVALVGHEPDLSLLIGWLLAGRRLSFVEVKKGSVCLLEFARRIEPGGAVLQWFLKPSQLVLLGDSHP